MGDLSELNLRWLAASIGLPEDEKAWSDEQVEKWVLVVHDYQDKLSVERLTKQLKAVRMKGRKVQESSK